MDHPTGKDRSAAILQRLIGGAFVLLGFAILFATYIAMTTRPAQAAHPALGAIMGISISVLGVVSLLLRRWAVILLSVSALAFSSFIIWEVVRGLPFPASLLVSLLYLVIGAIPSLCMYYAWDDLR